MHVYCFHFGTQIVFPHDWVLDGQFMRFVINLLASSNISIAINTAWRVFVFRVFLVRIFRHFSLSCIQSECGKIRTRKTPNRDTFYVVQLFRCTSVINIVTLHKKWSFSIKISSVNVTKSAENCGFGHIYWRNP